MNSVIKVLIFHLSTFSFLLISDISSADVPYMTCIAKHEQSEQLFIGEGYRFASMRKALEKCAEFARDNDLDPTLCRIVDCE